MCFMRAVWAQSFPRYPYRVASVFAHSMWSSMLTLLSARSEISTPFSQIAMASSRRVSYSSRMRSCSCSSSNTVATAMA
jgi:hypothetical protein